MNDLYYIPSSRGKVAVAIPARDEEDHIGPCLDALNHQTVPPDLVLILLNNCTDGSESVIRGKTLKYPCKIASVELPKSRSSAGFARRYAMEQAAFHVGFDGVLMTTDADAIVPSDWIERNLQALAAGADAVCGRAILTDQDAATIPWHLRADDAREQHFLTLMDTLAGLIDPDPINPLPRHTEASGASIAVTTAAWHRAGGIPPVRTGEDRGFIAALRRIDAGIRHDPSIEVTVSARLLGRAEGGMAATIQRRMMAQDEFTDDLIEPPDDALRRFQLRARLRTAWQTGQHDASLANALEVTPDQLQHVLLQRCFGSAWEIASGMGALTARERVRFVDLPRMITRAEELLVHLAPFEARWSIVRARQIRLSTQRQNDTTDPDDFLPLHASLRPHDEVAEV